MKVKKVVNKKWENCGRYKDLKELKKMKKRK